jgi:hypothetical protein
VLWSAPARPSFAAHVIATRQFSKRPDNDETMGRSNTTSSSSEYDPNESEGSEEDDTGESLPHSSAIEEDNDESSETYTSSVDIR